MVSMEYIKGRKGFTLIEMIIAVALLAVAGTVAVRLFIHAHVSNRLAADIDRSVFHGSAWIEKIKASPEDWIGGDPSALESVVSVSDAGSYVIYYDDGWQPLSGIRDPEREAAYAMHIGLYSVPGSDGLWAIDLRSFKIKPYPLRQKPYEEIYAVSAMLNTVREVVEP
ncbi:prepilin-type N-terminal cleavage/methylation domain-containing protein [Thermoclostridium caenicola]|uniref:Prepilin-type N-terminal cleavage/methylation domain-containing protein n=2 Tax=Thermoclostridium caenicola TaxID=659425 RepID=A0A1M6HSY4_9FIRM|nr:prepilin-type N-terminal cleavage/methylation domain-containing protein [Thermoclostridium caenicola]